MKNSTSKILQINEAKILFSLSGSSLSNKNTTGFYFYLPEGI